MPENEKDPIEESAALGVVESAPVDAIDACITPWEDFFVYCLTQRISHYRERERHAVAMMKLQDDANSVGYERYRVEAKDFGEFVMSLESCLDTHRESRAGLTSVQVELSPGAVHV